MTQKITQTLLREKKKLLSQDSKNAYYTLKGTLSAVGSHVLFAEPIPTADQKGIIWFTELAGELISFADLPAEEKAKAREVLGKEIAHIRQLLTQYKNEGLRELIETALIVPTEQDIYATRQGVELKVILTQWGYTQDIPNADTDILRKFIEIPRYKLTFSVQYENGTPLPAIPFQIKIKGLESKIYETDTQGGFAFEVPEGKEIQVEATTPAYKNNFVATKNKHIALTFPNPTQDMLFEVWDTNDVLVSKSDWEFDYNGQKIPHTTDHQGRIILPQVWFGTAISVCQYAAGKAQHRQSYTCTEGQKIYIIRLPILGQNEMLFRVMKGKKVVPEALLKLRYTHPETRQEENLPTNAQGEYKWEKVPEGAKVTATASKKFKTRKHQITQTFLYKKDKEAYILRFKSYLWVWLFLLLLPFVPIPVSLDFEVVDAYKQNPIQQPTKPLVTLQYDLSKKESKNTNHKGIASFGNKWVFLFEYLYPLSVLETIATCDCFKKEGAKGSYWQIPKKYKLPLQTVDTTFTVLEAGNGAPIAHAKVQLLLNFSNIYKESIEKETDKDGKVRFEKMPTCGHILLSASKEGYKSDTLRGIVKDLKTYTLKMCHLSKYDKLIQMVFVTGGRFKMGSESGEKIEKPVHEVSLDGFYMSNTEITQELWEGVMGNNPAKHKCSTCPVENVNWGDIQIFLEKLNRATCSDYRLPTEAEWEFAARGGTKSEDYVYAGGNEANAVMWYNDNSGGKTHPVAEKQANELGLYDMSGNVEEWTNDYWQNPYPNTAQNNPTITNGTSAAVRGGAFGRPTKKQRCTERYTNHHRGCRHPDLGFRITKSK